MKYHSPQWNEGFCDCGSICGQDQGGHRNGWKRHNLREMRAGPTATVLFLDRLSLLLKRCLERERVPLVNILIVRMPGAPSGFSFSFPCQLKTPNNGRKKWISYNLCLNFLAYFMFWGSFLGFEWQWLVRALLVTGWTHTRLSYQATISNWTFSWVEGSHIF